MSLAIDIDLIEAVLLPDGWHDVTNGSFDLDAYEYLDYDTRNGGLPPDHDPLIIHGGGRVGICATGFGFTTHDGQLMFGPLTAILAVRTQPKTTDDQ